jgi:glutamate-1-semialdehyde 2,1-aminomutase
LNVGRWALNVGRFLTNLVISNSSKLFSRAQKCIPGGVNSPVRAFRNVEGQPFFVDRAEGARIYDVDEREYIDFVGSWGPAILGHAPKVVVDAVRDGAERGTSFGIPNPLEVELAELICKWMPSIKKVRMVNSGTEATMSCIRLARGFARRDKIIKFDGCYHGHADGLLVVPGSGILAHSLPSPQSSSSGRGGREAPGEGNTGIPQAFVDLTISLPYNNVDLVQKAFRENKNEIAAVILEPIPANAGLYFPKENFLSILREECTKHGALLIFDEVMTGFRVARGGAQEIYGIKPDLTALGKVIGGGLPVGAFGGRAEIMDQLSPNGPVYQAGTLSGNPLAMAAGLAQLRELERINGWKLLEELGAEFERLTRDALAQSKIETTFHRIGSMFCLFFAPCPIVDLASAKRSDLKLFAKFFHGCLDRGVYFAPSQFETGFISTAHTMEDLAKATNVMREVLLNL